MESARLYIDDFHNHHNHHKRQLPSPIQPKLFCPAREILKAEDEENFVVEQGEEEQEEFHKEDYNLWFEDYSKALRQKTEISLGIDNNKQEDGSHPRLRRTSSMPSVVEALNRAVTTTEKLRHYNYDIKLNKLQKRALRFTWHRLHTRNGGKRVENVFEEIYDRLMRMLPTMREMFTTRTFLSAMSKQDVATLRDHARFTAKMFDTVIKNLDTEDKKRTDTLSEYDPVLVGRAHTCLKPYGFIGTMWEKLGETIIDVILIQEAVRDLPGAGQAWVILTACVIDQLRAGFEQNRDNYTRYHASGGCPVSSNTHQYTPTAYTTNHHQSPRPMSDFGQFEHVQQQKEFYDNVPIQHPPQQYYQQQQQASSAMSTGCPLHFSGNFKYADETPGSTDGDESLLNGSRKSLNAQQQAKASSRNNSADRLSNPMSDEENIQFISMPPQSAPRNSLPCPSKMPITHMHSADHTSHQLLSPYGQFAQPTKHYCSSDNLSVTSDSTLSNSRRGSQPATLRDDTPVLYRSSLDNQL